MRKRGLKDPCRGVHLSVDATSRRSTHVPAVKADDRDESTAKRDDYADSHNDGDVTSRTAMTATSSAAALIVISSVVITMTPAVITFDATSCEYVGYHQVRRQRR